MKKRRKIRVVGLLAVFAFCLIWILQSRQPGHEGRSVSYWMRMINDYSATAEAREQARNAFQAMGPEAIPYIFSEIRRVNGPLRKRYRQIWPKLPEFVKKRLSEPKSEVEAMEEMTPRAWQALRSVGPSSIPMLIKALEDPNGYIREAALIALQSLNGDGYDVADSIPALIRRLSDADGFVRLRAVNLLGEMGPRAEPAVPALVELLDDNPTQTGPRPIFPVRDPALKALVKTGVRPDQILAKVNEMLEGPETVTSQDYLIAAKATIAIWRMTGETTNTVQRLIDLWPHISNSFKPNVLEVFGEMGPAAAEAAPFLSALIEKEESEASAYLRFYAANALNPDFSQVFSIHVHNSLE